ncbi:hypothetical protein CEUSTIGMA_g3956.t1 [Chlamydomonas eustigma]|uniref:Autophagy-related protein 13 N-terminal domain-containing protein n=1 Tax=Chlamydomonas eustigma TaxID=1157962 RepID=A0A250X194_9CHLO|nr:hypothetical protein CEUSTIGMA_g3956.t1 [Chlamydomonas eustigma]|eukprot:GAX76510.1 hypothetical protein CEUSTIGMA_g3956.t1 [Chlamydomonas eustigma]
MVEKSNANHFVCECFVKCSQIILSSRVLGSECKDERRGSRWFNVEVEEVGAAKGQLEPWRRDLSHPLTIEISASSKTSSSSSSTEDLTLDPGVLLERWVLKYQQTLPASSNPGAGTSSREAATPSTSGRSYVDDGSIYKRMVLLTRALYTQLRMLPAYKTFKASKGSGSHIMRYNIAKRTMAVPEPHGVSSHTSSLDMHPPPQPPHQPRNLRRLDFAKIDTPGGGVFCISVEYNPDDLLSNVPASQVATPLSVPRVIPDYFTSSLVNRTSNHSRTTSTQIYSTSPTPRVSSTLSNSPAGGSKQTPVRMSSTNLSSTSNSVAASPGVGSLGGLLTGRSTSSSLAKAASIGVRSFAAAAAAAAATAMGTLAAGRSPGGFPVSGSFGRSSGSSSARGPGFVRPLEHPAAASGSSPTTRLSVGGSMSGRGSSGVGGGGRTVEEMLMRTPTVMRQSWGSREVRALLPSPEIVHVPLEEVEVAAGSSRVGGTPSVVTKEEGREEGKVAAPSQLRMASSMYMPSTIRTKSAVDLQTIYDFNVPPLPSSRLEPRPVPDNNQHPAPHVSSKPPLPSGFSASATAAAAAAGERAGQGGGTATLPLVSSFMTPSTTSFLDVPVVVSEAMDVPAVSAAARESLLLLLQAQRCAPSSAPAAARGMLQQALLEAQQSEGDPRAVSGKLRPHQRAAGDGLMQTTEIAQSGGMVETRGEACADEEGPEKSLHVTPHRCNAEGVVPNASISVLAHHAGAAAGLGTVAGADVAPWMPEIRSPGESSGHMIRGNNSMRGNINMDVNSPSSLPFAFTPSGQSVNSMQLVSMSGRPSGFLAMNASTSVDLAAAHAAGFAGKSFGIFTDQQQRQLLTQLYERGPLSKELFQESSFSQHQFYLLTRMSTTPRVLPPPHPHNNGCPSDSSWTSRPATREANRSLHYDKRGDKSSLTQLASGPTATAQNIISTPELLDVGQDGLFSPASKGTEKGLLMEEAEAEFFPFALESGGDLSVGYESVRKDEQGMAGVRETVDPKNSTVLNDVPCEDHPVQKEGVHGGLALPSKQQGFRSWGYQDLIPSTLASLAPMLLATERDVAVGAFLTMLEVVPPLNSPGISMQQASKGRQSTFDAKDIGGAERELAADGLFHGPVSGQQRIVAGPNKLSTKEAMAELEAVAANLRSLMTAIEN